MATKSSLPRENAWMHITPQNIADLKNLNIILNTTLKSRSHYRNLTRLASISEKKLDELLKLVNVIINDDGTMNVGRFLVKPIPRGREMSENMRGSITGEVVSIVPVDSTAGKTRKRRRKKGKGTRRR